MRKKTYSRPKIYIRICETAQLLAGSIDIYDEEANGSTVYAPIYKNFYIFDEEDEDD